MKVKLDENLGQSRAQLLRDAGHIVQRVTEQGLSGAEDSHVIRYMNKAAVAYYSQSLTRFGGNKGT